MKKATDITIILDRSGSMTYIKEATIEGFNSFLKNQKENKLPTYVSLVQFDDLYETVYTDIPIQEANYLNDKTFEPRGATALLDAIGTTIKANKNRVDKETQVMIVILTDGYENASTQYSSKDIFKKIRKREKKNGWQFIFIGANQDAIQEASKIGISRNKALEFKSDSRGVKDAFLSLSHKMSIAQLDNSESFAFDEEDRNKQKH